MDSVPEYYVQPERDRSGIPTGNWIWEVYDALSGGPINGGVAFTKESAHSIGSKSRANVERGELYCGGSCDGYKLIGIDACSGCSGRI